MLPALLHLVDDYTRFRYLPKHICLTEATAHSDFLFLSVAYKLSYLLTYLKTPVGLNRNQTQGCSLLR